MTEIQYTRPYLYPLQEQALFNPKRWALIEASTKSGKTVGCITWIIEQALNGQRGWNYWWIAPVSSQSDIAFTRVKNGLPQGSFRALASPYPRVELINGTVIWFKSGDNPDCFDAQTEILTNEGWKLFSNLNRAEQVLTLNCDTLVAEWKTPVRYIEQKYTGNMYRIASGKLDLLVTPNHRFFIKTRNTGNPRGRPIVEKLKHKLSHKKTAAREVLLKTRAESEGTFSAYKFKAISDIDLCHDRIPARVGWVGIDSPNISEDVCALLGIYLSEGCASGSFGGTTALANGDYTVHFSQTDGIKGGIKGNVREQMRELFKRLELVSMKETEAGFFIRNKELWKVFSTLGNCYDKFIPPIMKELPPEKLRVLLHWLLLGDGTLRQDTEAGVVAKTYYTVSPQLADDVQEIAIKAGFSAIIREKKQVASMLANGRIITPTTSLYQVNLVHSEFNHFADSLESYVSQEDYDGMVYCIESENQTVLVRRNGKVCWSGNSLFGEDVYAAVIDEASRCKDDVWHAVRSTLTATGGPCRIIGNVKGRKNWFYEFARRVERGKEPNGHFAKITVLDAIAAGVIPADEVEDAKRNLPEHVFRELYMAEPAGDSGNPFGDEHIELCVGALSQQPPVAFGVDLAKKADWLVVIGLDADGSVCAFHRWQGVPWRDSIRRIHRIIGEDSPALVDSTGVGDPVLEELQVGHGNFTGYNFSSPSKQKLMEGLAVSIQGHEITFPEGHIKNELLAFEYKLTPSGVRYQAAEGYSDDCVCALALAREQFTTSQPGANLIEYFERENSRQKRRAAEQDLLTSDFDDLDVGKELSDLYAATISRYAPEKIRCAYCDGEMGASKTTDGVFVWHPSCPTVSRRVA